MLEHFTAAELGPKLAHRMMAISPFSGMATYYTGISNAATVLKLPCASCLKSYVIFPRDICPVSGLRSPPADCN